jgi:hypothetical protein
MRKRKGNKIISIINGVVTILLTKDQVCMFDEKYLDLISQYTWYAKDGCNTFYARSEIYISKRKIRMSMHQLILGKRKGYVIDHRNENGLDNRRENLRHLTNEQNVIRCGPSKNKKYKGVFSNKSGYMARLMRDKILCPSKHFKNEIDAAKHYDKLVIEHYPDMIGIPYLNFPLEYWVDN